MVALNDISKTAGAPLGRVPAEWLETHLPAPYGPAFDALRKGQWGQLAYSSRLDAQDQAAATQWMREELASRGVVL